MVCVSQGDLSPWYRDWSCWTRGQMPRRSAAGWSWRWWPPGGRRPRLCTREKQLLLRSYFHNKNNKHNDVMHITFIHSICRLMTFFKSQPYKKKRSRRNSTCNSTDKPFSSNTVLKKMMCSSSVTLREICQHQNTHTDHYLVVHIFLNYELLS